MGECFGLPFKLMTTGQTGADFSVIYIFPGKNAFVSLEIS
jgi:hypothetical protein